MKTVGSECGAGSFFKVTRGVRECKGKEGVRGRQSKFGLLSSQEMEILNETIHALRR